MPLKVTYINLSSIGSMSSMCCMKLLCTIIPTPALYSFLVPLVFWFALVSCTPHILAFFFIHFSPPSLPLFFLCDPYVKIVILHFAPNAIFILIWIGSWALALIFCLSIFPSFCCHSFSAFLFVSWTMFLSSVLCSVFSFLPKLLLATLLVSVLFSLLLPMTSLALNALFWFLWEEGSWLHFVGLRCFCVSLTFFGVPWLTRTTTEGIAGIFHIMPRDIGFAFAMYSVNMIIFYMILCWCLCVWLCCVVVVVVVVVAVCVSVAVSVCVCVCVCCCFGYLLFVLDCGVMSWDCS